MLQVFVLVCCFILVHWLRYYPVTRISSLFVWKYLVINNTRWLAGSWCAGLHFYNLPPPPPKNPPVSCRYIIFRTSGLGQRTFGCSSRFWKLAENNKHLHETELFINSAPFSTCIWPTILNSHILCLQQVSNHEQQLLQRKCLILLLLYVNNIAIT